MRELGIQIGSPGESFNLSEGGFKMKDIRIAVAGRAFALACVMGLGVAGILVSGAGLSIAAQPQAPKSAGTRLEVVPGSTASYRVQEQIVGISLPNEAVGSTDAVTGSLVLAPDGSIVSDQSKLSIDLRTLKSDQDRRDQYIKGRTLETDKFPMAEFVPKSVQGLASPLPTTGISGYQLTGDLTIHGVTKEVTWNGIATFSKDQVAGHAKTDFTFATFGLTKPMIGILLSVDDKIQLELEFRMKRTD
jgi:polyisoprenoid-binding protein YceI